MNEHQKPAGGTLSPQTIMDIVSAYQKSRILLTAYELDLFTAVGDGRKTSVEVAETIKADPRATDRLMNALCSIDLLEKKEGRFSNAPLAARFLVRGKPEFMANLMHSANLWRPWSTLTEAVRCGTSVVSSHAGERNEGWFHAFISAMHWRGSSQAPELAVGLDLSNVSRVLDVGGGSGAYAMAIVQAKEGIEAVVFDLPNVIPLAENYIREAGLAHKVKTVVGDYEQDEFGSGFDLVLFSAIIHSNSPVGIRELFSKAWRALNPGGRVVVSDFIMDEDRTSPARGAMFAINMLVATQAGDTYTEREVREWMEETGFIDIEKRDTRNGPALMIGRKAGV